MEADALAAAEAAAAEKAALDGSGVSLDGNLLPGESANGFEIDSLESKTSVEPTAGSSAL